MARLSVAGPDMRVRLFLFPAGDEVGDDGLELGLDLRLTELLHLALGQPAARDQAVEEGFGPDVEAVGRESVPPPFARPAQAQRVGAGARPLDRGRHGDLAARGASSGFAPG